MSLERAWEAVPDTALTSNGTALGVITIADTQGFYTKQSVSLKSNTLPPIQLQVQEVLSSTQLVVGVVGPKVGRQSFIDVSAYLVVDHATISAAQQAKGNIPDKDHYAAVYMPDPVVGDRVIPVDPYGKVYGPNNPIPVSVKGSFPVSVRRLTDKPNDGTPDNLPDAIQIGDGTNRVKVNSDGSLNVASASGAIQNVVTRYNEVNSVASGATTSVATYTVPGGITKGFLQRIQVSGENIARFDVYVNASPLATKRTYFGGSLNETFEFGSFNNIGVNLNIGDVVTVKVLHNRPSTASFEGTIQVVEVT